MSNKLFCFVAISYAALMTYSTHAMEILPKKMPESQDIYKSSPVIVELGKKLYFDPRLSRDGSVSCNSCHNVMASGEDNRPNSVGILGQRGGRAAPTVFNAGLMSVQFWDGRANSLEDQAKGPLTNPIEMGMPNHAAVIDRLKKIPGYAAEFKKAFPKEKDITIDQVAYSIASYERTLLTPNAPVDRYLNGNKKALSEAAIRGMKKVEEVGCTSCHSGPNYAGPALPIGTGFFQRFPVYPGSDYDKKYGYLKDKGRYEVTKKDEDKNMWRVPTWRNVALTAPYFHNGSVETLPEAVKVMAKTQLNKDLTDSEVSDIVAFLEGLTGEVKTQTMPRLPGTNGFSLVSRE